MLLIVGRYFWSLWWFNYDFLNLLLIEIGIRYNSRGSIFIKCYSFFWYLIDYIDIVDFKEMVWVFLSLFGVYIVGVLE